MVCRDAAAVAAAAFRRLRRHATEDHLGDPRYHHHRASGDGALSLAAAAQIGRQPGACRRKRLGAGAADTMSGRGVFPKHRTLGQILAVPALIVAMSIDGHISALVGDGVWDGLSWLM